MTTPAEKVGLDWIRQPIVAEIKRQGLTPAKAAKAAGIQPPQIYDYLAGRSNLGAAALDRLITVLGITFTPHGPLEQVMRDIDWGWEE